MEEPPATFVYISPDQNQCRRGLNYVCCLWSVCTPLLSMREQSIEGARPPFGIGSGASASWPRPHSVRRINHVYLSTYFSQTSSVAWHWLAGVFCLSLSQSRPTIESLPPRPPPLYRMQLVEKKELPKLPLPANTSAALPSAAVTTRGRDFDIIIYLSSGCLSGAHNK